MQSTPIGAPLPVPWENGGLVGRYILLSPIAQGGMAEIWLARQSGMQGFEKVVVIKRMTAALQADKEHVEMFLSEARLAAQLNHPHVVQIFDLGEQDQSYYIAMEYLDGENLSVVRRSSRELGMPMPDPVSARVISWAAEGLHYAHTRVGLDGKPLQIVHRDVSPQNLIVTYDGGLKVVDFGIAKVANQTTLSGTLKGKLAYMSPEQARAEPSDARSDVFSLGMVLFETITQQRLLTKMDDIAMLHYMAGNDPLPRPSERRPDVPRGLESIVMKALQRAPAQRFQTARDMQAALEEWIRLSGASVTGTDVSDYMGLIFADRIRQRREIIEAAMNSNLAPNAAHSLQALARAGGTGDPQSDSRSSRRYTLDALKGGPKVPVLVALLGLLGVLGVGTGLYFTLRGGAEAHPVAADAGVALASPRLEVETDPSGANLSVDGAPKGQSPLELDSLGVGEHTLVATLSGYRSSTKVVKLSAGGKTSVLLPLGLDKTAVTAPVDHQSVEDPTPDPIKNPVKDPKRSSPRPVAKKGSLSLNTDPWTQVFLGKQKLGDTPLLNFPLPAGRHELRLVSPDTGLDTSIEVEIKPNELTVEKLRL